MKPGIDAWVKTAKAVNDYVNKSVPYVKPDDLSTAPLVNSLEEAQANGGRCGDYVKQKALMLAKSFGVPAEAMRVRIGHTELPGPNGDPVKTLHSVLTFQPDGMPEPLVLDNENGHMLPLSARPDIQKFGEVTMPADWLEGQDYATR